MREAAALAMLDELRGMFATGVLRDARRLGGGCLLELTEAFSTDRLVPEAVIGGRPVIREISELATLCTRAHAWFATDPNAAVGLVRQILQLAADLEGGERAVHELRDDCGRSIAFATMRPVGFPMLQLPIAVVHPSQWSAAAARLGVTVDELRKREPAVLAEQLGDALVRSIPRIRPEGAPPRYFLAQSRYAGPTVVDDPLAMAYERLGLLVARFQRLAGAPEQVLTEVARSIQEAVDEVAAAAVATFEPTDAWTTTMPEVHPGMTYRGPETDAYDGLPRVIWLSDDRIAIVRTGGLAVVSLTEQRVVRTIPLGWGDRPTSCDPTGRYVLVEGMFAPMLACLDTETGVWLDKLPDGCSAISVHKNDVDVDTDVSNDLFMFELRRHRVAAFEGAWPTPLAWTRGNRDVLISYNFDSIGTHGIRASDTLLEQVSSATLMARNVAVPVLLADGTLVDPNPRFEAAMRERWYERWGEPWPCAIAQVDARWRFLLPTLHVADVDDTWFQLGFAIDAASWSPDGQRLVTLGDELVIIDVASRKIISRGVSPG